MGGAKSVATVLHQTTLRCHMLHDVVLLRACNLQRCSVALGFRFGFAPQVLDASDGPRALCRRDDAGIPAEDQRQVQSLQSGPHSASTQASLRMTTPHLHPSAFPCGHGGASLMPHHRKVASEFGPQRSLSLSRRCRSLQVIDNAVRESELHPACGTYLITYRAPSPQSAPVCEPPHRLHPSVASCYTVRCCSL